MSNKPSLSVNVETAQEIRALKSNGSLINQYDKLSLWTLASDIKTSNGGNLEDLYSDVIDTASEDMEQHEELVQLLRDMGSGVTKYSTIDKLTEEAKKLNSPIIEALEEMTGESVYDTTTQGVIDHINRYNRRMMNTLKDLNLVSTGIQGILSALEDF